MDETQTPINSPNMTPTSPIIPTISSKSPLALIIKIIAGVVGVAIVGGGVSLAARIWDPLWNPFRPKPEEVIEEMTAKMEEVKTLHSEIKIEFETTNEKLEQEMRISLTFSSDSDVANPESSKVALNFGLEITNLKAENFLLEGESRTIGDTSYLKLDTIKIPPGFAPLLMMLDIDLSKIQGQWIKVDKEVLESLEGGADEPEISEEEQKKLREKLLKLFKEKKVYYVKEELPDQKINEKKAYHYLLALDREKIKEVIPELFKIIMEFSGEETPGIGEFGTAFMAGGIAESIDKFLEKIGGIDIEIWIGKKDALLYKVKIDKEIDVSKFGKEAEGKITFKFDVEFSNFNQQIEITAPENFIGLEELMPQIPFYPGVRTPLEIPERQKLKLEYYEEPFIRAGSLFQSSLFEVISRLLR